MATKTFTGTNGSWNTSSNWSPTGVPTSTDDVIINNNCTLNITPATVTVNSLQVNTGINNGFNINGKTITVTTSAIVKNSSYVTNGNIYATSITFINTSYLRTDVVYGLYGTYVSNNVNAYASNFYFYSDSYATDYSNLSGNNLYMYGGSDIGRNQSSCIITNFAYLYDNSSFARGIGSNSTCLLSAFDTSSVGAQITKTCYFYNTSVNNGYIQTSAYFYNNTTNNQFVNIGIFNDYSRNVGTVYYAYLNDYTNNIGNVTYKIYFNNNKLSNASFVTSIPTYFLYTTNGVLNLSGTQTLNLSYPQSAYDSNNNVISSYYFTNNSKNYTKSLYNGFFQDYSLNYGGILTFASFKNNAYNYGFVTSATFYDNSINYGTILNNTYFNNNSYNTGYIGNSSIYTNNNGILYGTVSNNVYKLNTIPPSSWYEPAIIYNDTPITTFVFGTSSNNLTLPYNAIFNGYAINTGNLKSNNLYNGLLAFYDFSKDYDTDYFYDKSENKNNLLIDYGYNGSKIKINEKFNNNFVLNLSSVYNINSNNFIFDSFMKEFTICFWILTNDNTNNKTFLNISPFYFSVESTYPYFINFSNIARIPCTPNTWNFICIRGYSNNNSYYDIMLNNNRLSAVYYSDNPFLILPSYEQLLNRSVIRDYFKLNLTYANLKISNLAFYDRVITEDERLYFYNNGQGNFLPTKTLKTKAIFNDYSKNFGGSSDIIIQNNINKGVNSPQLMM